MATLTIKSKSTGSTQRIDFTDYESAVECVTELKNTTPAHFEKNEYIIDPENEEVDAQLLEFK